jgi:hypothetical protein
MIEKMDLERFTKFYNELLVLKESCQASHEALVADMLKLIQEHKDRLLELKPASIDHCKLGRVS